MKKSAFMFVIASCLYSMSIQADFTAHVNTQTISKNQPFDLTLSTDDPNNLQTAIFPDLTPLDSDFEILSMSQSMQTHIINGHTTRKRNWIITLSPKRIPDNGKLSIPKLRLGNENTDPITLHTLKTKEMSSQNDQSITLTTRINHTKNSTSNQNNYYVFQEIPLSIYIETTQPIANAELIMSDIDGVEIEQTGQDKQTQRVENGQLITTIERTYTLRPQTIGKFEIPPVVVRGNFLANANRHNTMRNSSIDEMSQQLNQLRQQLNQSNGHHSGTNVFDSTLQAMLGGVGNAFISKSDSIIIDVKANPNGVNQWFLPAKTVEIHSKWLNADGNVISKPTFREGDVINRQISLIAVGAEPEQLPQLDMTEVDGIQLYIDENKTERITTNTGVVARRQLTISVIPEYAGTFTLPKITVNWLNINTDQAEVATLNSETIHVNEQVQTHSHSALPANQSSTTIKPNDTSLPQQNSGSTTIKDHLENTSKDKDTKVFKGTWLEKTIFQQWNILRWLISFTVFLIVAFLTKWVISYRQEKINRRNSSDDLNHSKNLRYDLNRWNKSHLSIGNHLPLQNYLSEYQPQLITAITNKDIKKLYQCIMQLKQKVQQHSSTEESKNQLQLIHIIQCKLEYELYNDNHQANKQIDFNNIERLITQIFNCPNFHSNDTNNHELPKLYPN